MSVIVGGLLNGTPLEPLLALLIGLPVGILVIVLIFKIRGKGEAGSDEDAPATQRLGFMLQADQNKTLQLGKLLEGLTLTDKDIVFHDPDIMDVNNPELPKEQHVAYEDIIPAQLKDINGTILEFWGLIRSKGEYRSFSFADIVQSVRHRFDPLPADPRDVGGHYVPMARGQGGLTQLLQSNTGKFLVISGCVSFGTMLGLILGHIAHF